MVHQRRAHWSVARLGKGTAGLVVRARGWDSIGPTRNAKPVWLQGASEETYPKRSDAPASLLRPIWDSGPWLTIKRNFSGIGQRRAPS
jgi:hypothetical protein